MQTKKLYLSSTDKKIAGVCGGIGERFEIEPTLIRLAFIFLTIMTGIIPGVVMYISFWIIIPKSHKNTKA
ncbi:MAG: phage shock protein C [Parcubacteria group bacterium Athens0714_16]|nr:MAG: phage shock protein C [Parcubacteria group bacterium Athens0714_16]